MKSKKLFYRIMEMLPFFITCICFGFLPDQIPAHYNFNNVVDRWGSRYETFILPVTIIFLGEGLLLLGKLSSRKEQNNNNNNEKVIVYAGMGGLLLWNVMQYYFLYIDFKRIGNLSDSKIDLYSTVFTVLGIMLVICGNYMPKCKMNSIVGVRTVWSQKNEKAWAMSQKFGGISFCICGILMIAGNLIIFRGTNSLLYSLILLAVDTVISVYYSYYAAKVSEK